MPESTSPTGLLPLDGDSAQSQLLPLGFRKIFYRDIVETERGVQGKFWVKRIEGVELSGTSYELPLSNWGV